MRIPESVQVTTCASGAFEYLPVVITRQLGQRRVEKRGVIPWAVSIFKKGYGFRSRPLLPFVVREQLKNALARLDIASFLKREADTGRVPLLDLFRRVVERDSEDRFRDRPLLRAAGCLRGGLAQQVREVWEAIRIEDKFVKNIRPDV